MLKVLGILLVVWLAFVLVGVLVKGFVWLLIIGAVAFVGTAAYGAIKSKSGKQIN